MAQQKALSDSDWRAICGAARRAPDDEAAARAEVSAIFAEHSAFAYNRARWAQALKRSDGALKALKTLEVARRAQFVADATRFLPDDARTVADLYWIKMLRQRWEAIWLAARAIRRAHKGKKNVQHEMLTHRLCGVWLDHFHGELRVAVRARDGTPRGPCIAFLRVAMSQVVPKPSPATLRDAVYRERDEREAARQYSLDLEAGVARPYAGLTPQK